MSVVQNNIFRLYNQGVASVDIQQIFKQASSKTTKPNPKVRNVAQVSYMQPTQNHHPTIFLEYGHVCFKIGKTYS